MSAPASAGDPPARGPARRAIAFAVGIILLGAAAWVLASHEAIFLRAWGSVRTAPPWLIACGVMLPLVNYAIISCSFWLLMRREGPVALGEMSALIGAAWLLNFAPLRPGLAGRVAYHRLVNQIPVARVVWVTIVGIGAGGAAVLTLVFLIAVPIAREPGPARIALASAPLVAGLIGAGLLATRGRASWVYPATYALRYLDVLVWTARYAVYFALVGAPVTAEGAAAFAAVCQITLLLPLIGNGVGIREWAIALTAASLPAGVFAVGGASRELGLAADLLNRAAELVVAVPLGLVCMVWLTRRVRRRADERGRTHRWPAGS